MEHDEQAKVIKWARHPALLKQFPELRWLHAIPNGAYLKSKITAARMVREGLTKGVLDLYLPVIRGPFCGLYVEMKYGKNDLSASQEEFAEFVKLQGRAVAVCWDAVSAIDAITDYLTGNFIDERQSMH